MDGDRLARKEPVFLTSLLAFSLAEPSRPESEGGHP